MNKPAAPKNPTEREMLVAQIDAEASRRVRARQNSDKAVWFGLGMMGLVGWSVSIPTLLGAGIGIWLDKNHPGAHSWTLALLVAGLTLGCFNAWRWISKQDLAMHEGQEADHE
jgi:ATP synthase protein I